MIPNYCPPTAVLRLYKVAAQDVPGRFSIYRSGDTAGTFSPYQGFDVWISY